MNRLEEIYEEGQSYLEGDKRFEWLEALVRQPAGYRDLAHAPDNFPEHVQKGKELLQELHRAGSLRVELIKRWSEEDFEKVRTLMHMLYFLSEFEWASDFFDKKEKRMIREFNTIIGGLTVNDQVIKSRGRLGEIFDNLGDEGNDRLSKSLLWVGPYADAVARRERRPSEEFKVHCVTRNIDNEGSFETALRNFGIDQAQLDAITSDDECLEVGPGFSDFAVEMRKKGKTVWTADLHSIDDLLAKLQTIKEEDRLSLLSEPARALEFLEYMRANKDEMAKYHVAVPAGDITGSFGAGRFSNIFARDSIFQLFAYSLSVGNPQYFLQSILGTLGALREDGGTFYATTQFHWHLYSQQRMSRFMLPCIMSLLAGGFEIVGACDEGKEFSWDAFINKHILPRSTDESLRNTCVVRRGENADIERAVEFVNRFLPRRNEKNALAEICRDWPHPITLST